MRKLTWVTAIVLATVLSLTSCTAAPASGSQTSATEEMSATAKEPQAVDAADQAAIEREARVDEYAKVVAEAAQTKKGDRILINANTVQAEFVNKVAQECYAMGAKGVKITYFDQTLLELNNKYLTDEEYLGYYYDDIMSGYATSIMPEHKLITIDSVYFKQNTEEPHQSNPKVDEELGEFVQKHQLQSESTENDKELLWVAAAYPTKNWAKKVYPELSTEAAYNKMLDVFLDSARTGQDEDFSKHSQKLTDLAEKANKMDIVELYYHSKTADLRIPLHKNHVFSGGYIKAANGDLCNPNIPSEEIFTVPSKYGANGTVAATRSSILNGELVEGLKMTFKDGKLVDYSADSGLEIFEEYFKLPSEDVYLGEAALVSTDSPLFQSGKTFYSILLDENAGAHIALGRALTEYNLKQGTEPDENINMASYHRDIVIGSEDLTVTATLADGRKVDLLKDGKWAI